MVLDYNDCAMFSYVVSVSMFLHGVVVSAIWRICLPAAAVARWLVYSAALRSKIREE